MNGTRRGSTLLETLVALVILSLVLMALVTYMNRLNTQVDENTMPVPQSVLQRATEDGTTAGELADGWAYRVEKKPFNAADAPGLVLTRLTLEKNDRTYVFVTVKKEVVNV